MGNSVKEAKQKEKEKELKELRKEIEGEIREQLPTGEDVSETHVETYEEKSEVDFDSMKRIIEALLFVSNKPVPLKEMKKVVKGFKPSEFQKALKELGEYYIEQGLSFRVQELAGGYEISTHPQYAPWIMKLELEKKKKQATQSALETLAILAYKQPVTRVEIEELRGVNVSGVLSTLLDRNLIKIVGKKEIAGRPMLYGTTEKFLEHFGLKSLDDLPNISEIKELVASMINKEELELEQKTQDQAPVEEENKDAVEVDDTPSSEERDKVLAEITDVIGSANTKFEMPEEPKEETPSEEENKENPEEV